MQPLAPSDPRAAGEFRLSARLGMGGMGQVFLGYSPAGRAVAVKVCHPELAADPSFWSGSPARPPPPRRSTECTPRRW